jgi:tetratricopeptide (TPR) repeat protein
MGGMKKWLLVAVCATMLAGCEKPVAGLTAQESVNLASEAQQKGLYDEAIRHYKDAVRQDPEYALPHFELGVLLQEFRKDYAGAYYHFRTFIELDPKSEKKDWARARLNATERLLRNREAPVNPEVTARFEEMNRLLKERAQTIEALETQTATLGRDKEKLTKDKERLEQRLNLLIDIPEPAKEIENRNEEIENKELPPEEETENGESSP